MSGNLVNCDILTVIFSEDSFLIRKVKRFLSDERCPMLTIRSDWSRTGFPTLVNLGNVRHEAAFNQHPLAPLTLALIFSGFTAWTLLVIDAPWDWVRLFATAGLHTCLMLMLALPLWYEHQTGWPAGHLTVGRYGYGLQLNG